MLAVGMRRPHRLHKKPSDMRFPSEQDFGLEANHPSYTDIQSKRVEMATFVKLCELSEIMEAIAVFQQLTKFNVEWGRDIEGSDPAGLEEAIQLDQRLESWREAFIAAVSHKSGADFDQEVLVHVYILHILN